MSMRPDSLTLSRNLRYNVDSRECSSLSFCLDQVVRRVYFIDLLPAIPGWPGSKTISVEVVDEKSSGNQRNHQSAQDSI